jgi:hypothetical protein
VSDPNLYNIDLKNPDLDVLTRDPLAAAGPITQLTCSADGVLLMGRTVAGKCGVWILPPGDRLRYAMRPAPPCLCTTYALHCRLRCAMD